MKTTRGRNDALAEIGAILATGFAALRARRAVANEQARNAQEQAQLRPPSYSPELSGYPLAVETYVVVSQQTTAAAKEAK
jgi:hypothetical protein